MPRAGPRTVQRDTLEFNGQERTKMDEFTLPASLKYNRAKIQDPTAYAKESGSASWLFLVGEEFATMPGGMSYG